MPNRISSWRYEMTINFSKWANVHCSGLRTASEVYFNWVGTWLNLGVSKNRGTPISHPKMVIFKRKNHGCWGNPPFFYRRYIFKWWTSHCYVSLPECTSSDSESTMEFFNFLRFRWSKPANIFMTLRQVLNNLSHRGRPPSPNEF